MRSCEGSEPRLGVRSLTREAARITKGTDSASTAATWPPSSKSARSRSGLATLPGVHHAREVVVDEKRDLAWASSFADGSVIAFDTRTFKEKKRVTLAGSSPAGMAVDERTGTAYATDFANDRIIEIAPHAKTPRLIPDR